MVIVWVLLGFVLGVAAVLVWAAVVMAVRRGREQEEW